MNKVVPSSAQELTKLLRSKTISTAEIYDIAVHLDSIEVYFPNREVFLLELIGDRWNDQKLVRFKQDYKIWKIFNVAWQAIKDVSTKKKLFKNIRFVPHLIQTLALTDLELDRFLTELTTTCTLINGIMTVDVSAENAVKIVGSLLALLNRADYTDNDELLRQIIDLTSFDTILEANTKLSKVYCEQLLPHVLPYIIRVPEIEKETSAMLVQSISKFLFSSSVDSIKLIEQFLQQSRAQISIEVAVEFFQVSINTLLKHNFKQLQSIFTLVAEIQPKASSAMLSRLAASKKTMSYDFLETLFNKALDLSNERDAEFWSFQTRILELDIEVGIKHTSVIMDLIVSDNNQHYQDTCNLWSQLVSCHVNARELTSLLTKIEQYCQEKGEPSMRFLMDESLTHPLIKNIPLMSNSQLNDISAMLIESIIRNNSSIASHLLDICLSGLVHVASTKLFELEPVLSQVFDIHTETVSKLWSVKYLILQAYDDIIANNDVKPLEDDEFKAMLSRTKEKKDLFFYMFKLREYIPYNLINTVELFDSFFHEQSFDEQTELLKVIFTDLTSVVNTTFIKHVIEKLVHALLEPKRLYILKGLLEDDDLFEESNIMFLLVTEMSKMYNSKTIVELMAKIPIQCIHKSIRIELINNISLKADVTETGLSLLVHLLRNATFRSDIENNFTTLKQVIEKYSTCTLTTENVLFEKIWTNHQLQSKEAISQKFLDSALKELSEKIDQKDRFSFQMVFWAIKHTQKGSNLEKKFLNSILKAISTDDKLFLLYLLECLYFVLHRNQEYITEHNTTLKNTLAHLGTILASNTDEFKWKLGQRLFPLYSLMFPEKLDQLSAHYMVLRSNGIREEDLAPSLGSALDVALLKSQESFNSLLATVIDAFEKNNNSETVTEIYILMIPRLVKNNEEGHKLFLRSISEFHTYMPCLAENKTCVLRVLQTWDKMLVTKAWLFSQYHIEMLFPISLKCNYIFATSDDAVFVATTKLISSIFLVHRIKLSNRHHIVNSLICELLALLAQPNKLTTVSAQSLARLITNYCEPSNLTTTSKDQLNSRISLIRKSLRNDVPIIIVKFVHLSITAPFEAAIRKELLHGIYSIFDLLAQPQLRIISVMLDNAGRQYLKTLYADYTNVGKWQEN